MHSTLLMLVFAAEFAYRREALEILGPMIFVPFVLQGFAEIVLDADLRTRHFLRIRECIALMSVCFCVDVLRLINTCLEFDVLRHTSTRTLLCCKHLFEILLCIHIARFGAYVLHDVYFFSF